MAVWKPPDFLAPHQPRRKSAAQPSLPNSKASLFILGPTREAPLHFQLPLRLTRYRKRYDTRKQRGKKAMLGQGLATFYHFCSLLPQASACCSFHRVTRVPKHAACWKAPRCPKHVQPEQTPYEKRWDKGNQRGQQPQPLGCSHAGQAHRDSAPGLSYSCHPFRSAPLCPTKRSAGPQISQNG